MSEMEALAALARRADLCRPREREARELSTLRVAGEPFKCVCGANVFRAVDGIYMCNACGEEYSGDPREREGE